MENKVLLILTNGFEEIEAIGTIAILRRANIKIDVFSLNEENLTTGRYEVPIPLNKFDLNKVNLNVYNMLFIAGGPEYKELESRKDFLDLIKYFYDNGKFISAICAAPTILGHLGYLKNKKYTCFKSMNEDFGGTYIDKYSVIDEKIITGISAAGVIDFAFSIVEALKGKEEAEKVKNSIYYYDK